MAHSAIVPLGRGVALMETGAEAEAVREVQASQTSRGTHWQKVGWAAMLFSVLQAACPAIIALSGLRVLIGLGALASAAGTTAEPRGLHQDWIRTPMMALAALGAVLNLFVVWQLRRLRARPAAQWRLSPVNPAKVRSERVQIGLAVLTFALLIAEWITHPMVHLPRH